jgi:hypothetical protein
MARPNPILTAITNPAKNFLAFFAVGVLLFDVFSTGIANLFWENLGGWLQTLTGIQDPARLQLLMLLALGGLMLVVIYSTNLTEGVRWLFTKLRLVNAMVPQEARVVPLTDTCRGLVAIMGLGDNSAAEVALRHHWQGGTAKGLGYCWLITTAESLPFARRLHQKLIDEGIADQVQLFYSNHRRSEGEPAPRLHLEAAETHDPDRVLELVNAIYDHAEGLGLGVNEMIVDFTGGTKPMGVGAFLACTRPGRRLEYIAPGEPPQLVEIKIDYEIKRLNGGS